MGSQPAGPPELAHSVYAAWLDDKCRGDPHTFDELCARHPGIERDLRAIHKQVEQLASLLPLSSGPMSSSSRPESEGPFAELLARLLRHRPIESRYVEKREIARGGMGQLLEMYDVDLRRPVAKKVIKPRTLGERGPDQASPAFLGRFFEEAQVTAQLAHPGVVPVHELGIDEKGRVYFTMDLVVGKTLHEVFGAHRKGDRDWTLAGVVGVLRRVCETVAYAHSRGVLHRDLKPTNVMVGSFGEVYVMDWGLAKVLALDSRRTVTEPPVGDRPKVSTDRQDESDRNLFDGLLTQPGQVPGTAGYVAPERIVGRSGTDAPTGDVYALGAMLYELLAGSVPFADQLARGKDEYLIALQRGGPLRLPGIAPQAPPELVSICERAMASDLAQRYPSAKELADDLRRWLEGRVVLAHEQGPWAELRKWVARNKGLAASLALVVLLVAGGGFGWAVLQRRQQEAVELERTIADINHGPRALEGLLTEAERLWPSYPENLPKYRNWLEAMQGLRDKLPQFDLADTVLRGNSQALPRDQLLYGDASELEVFLQSVRSSTPVEEWIKERADVARSIGAMEQESSAARQEWSSASSAIRSSSHYAGLDLPPQHGLLPLREDPHSRLWEFWHVPSGKRPALDPNTNQWRIQEDTGVVLVLIPGGTYQLGSPDVSSDDDRYDKYASQNGSNPRTCTAHLRPFFISKYELTQAQWTRVWRKNPSRFKGTAASLPVDMVSWIEGRETLRRLNLEFPTEAQWEAAARGGEKTVYFTGRDPQSLAGYANVLPDLDGDEQLDLDQQGRPRRNLWGFSWKDSPIPVGSLKPNAYGLHDVHGNLWEWCADEYSPDAAPRDGDGLRIPSTHAERPQRVLRGGAYKWGPSNARLAFRYPWEEQNQEEDTGVRPARSVEGLP